MIMKDDEWVDKWEDFRDKASNWWETITLIVFLVSLVFLIIFTLKGNDDLQIISCIVMAMSYFLHVGNPLARGGGRPLG